MSISGLTAASRTSTAPDQFDHAIKLIDTTRPNIEADSVIGDSEASSSTGAPLARRGTKGTLREELARRKYAKWQEDKSKKVEDLATPIDDGSDNAKDDVTKRAGRLRDKIPFRHRKGGVVSKEKEDYVVDILYENQRGSFFCGIPLYSANSLLNFDPAPWQTSNFTDSAVNITNAQVPDPSWTWAWRSWYVDMSHDVDEEGWEYSFSFQKGFAWHGSHPWFHSFVRRRRWLRKRVKVHHLYPHRKHGGMKDAHMLNADYFTINANRDPSRESSADRTTNHHSSYLSSAGNYDNQSDSDMDLGEISDIAFLMTVLRNARVDREKIAAVKNFMQHGGDEIFYLGDRMPDIMAVFIYPSSRQQLQVHLRQTLDDTVKEQEGYRKSGEFEIETSKRRIGDLRKAVNAAAEHVNVLEYWSDQRAKSNKINPSPVHADSAHNVAAQDIDSIEEKTDEESAKVEKEIKGIPESAGVSEEPGIRWDATEDDVHRTALGTQAKGKAKV